MPIEDAARDAAKNAPPRPVIETPNKTMNVSEMDLSTPNRSSHSLSPVEIVMKAQRDYIRAQTQYRHDRSGDRLLEAQDAYIEQLHQFYESMAML
jgi:hypothetical protein